MKTVIKKIKSFFGFANKKTTSKLWHCSKCKLIFLSESASDKHYCSEKEIYDGKV
jgi:ribosomal protein L37AE/L43A